MSACSWKSKKPTAKCWRLPCKAFIQLRNGPFDLDSIFAPDGVECFEDAWKRRVERQGFPVANIEDIIASKQSANRLRDRESIPRLMSFREWLKRGGG